MRYSLYVLSLLSAYEDYLPFMTDEQILGILVWGREPDALSVAVWEMNRRKWRERSAEGRIEEALLRQK